MVLLCTYLFQHNTYSDNVHHTSIRYHFYYILLYITLLLLYLLNIHVLMIEDALARDIFAQKKTGFLFPSKTLQSLYD